MVRWICCQIGAREHYAVPRALARRGELALLFTDAWSVPGSPLGWLGAGMRGRFHADLAQACVAAPLTAGLGVELRSRLTRRRGWAAVIARNDWFQREAVRRLGNVAEADRRTIVFAYAYAARDILRHARSRGWVTVLGQIDPGPFEERLVLGLHARAGGRIARWESAPPHYWQSWREETSLADRIIVNSDWSRQAVAAEGVPQDKLRVVPLAVDRPESADDFRRTYPERFSHGRPLRVLFLGQINLRKGILELLDAARLLQSLPIEFILAGPVQIAPTPDMRRLPNVRWMGPVPRALTAEHYKAADVFILPTLSDGFGLTQLEACAWQLPVIASAHCGAVVEAGRSGIRLETVSGPCIAAVLRGLLDEPGQLPILSQGAAARAGSYALSALGEQLANAIA